MFSFPFGVLFAYWFSNQEPLTRMNPDPDSQHDLLELIDTCGMCMLILL
jgi:hypothetical protein